MKRSFPRSGKLLAAAAAVTLAAACHPAGARAPTTTHATFAAGGATAAVAPTADRVALDPSAPAEAPAPTAATALVLAVAPVPAAPVAAEPMCDADGRPLAGNVRKGGSPTCTVASAGPTP